MSRLSSGLLLIACLLIGWAPRIAQAVPAFARREGVSCQMCHFRVPELNEDGHAYLRRGLREEPGGMAEMPAMPAGTTMPMPTTPPTQPAAATPRPLGEPLPLRWADYLTVMGHHMVMAERGKRVMIDAGVLDLWIGGPLDQRWSALANPSFDIEAGGSGVEQAYGQYITHWDTRFGSARFGQLLPFAILFNQGGPSMPLSTPVVLETSADTGNPWSPTSNIRGVEVGAVNLARGSLYLGLGQPHVEEDDVGAAQPVDAGERHLDLYASGEYLFGKTGNSLTAYGYWGNATLPTGDDGRFHRFGAFANVFAARSKFVAGYLQGSDGTGTGVTLDNAGYFVLAEHLLSERWAAYARYDHFRQDLVAGGARTIQGPTLGITWWAQTQIRLTTEAQFLQTTGEPTDRKLTTEFMWVF